MTDPNVQNASPEWSEADTDLIKEIAPQAWEEWQHAFGNPDVMITAWDNVPQQTHVDWTNLMGQIVRYWELKKSEASR